MAEVINLNRFRKARAKTDQVRQADGNRLRHGRVKSEEERRAIERKRAERELDGKKLT